MTFTKYPGQTNKLIFAQYDVEITDTFSGGTEGFISHLSPLAMEPRPTTLDASLTVARSNIRYDRVIASISENATPVSVDHYEETAGEGTVFSFCVTFDRPSTIYTYDELENGELIDNDLDALKRQIARVFVASVTENRSVYDPTETDGILGNPDRQEAITAAALDDDLASAETAITIVKHHAPN